jgi:hypothetical protein
LAEILVSMLILMVGTLATLSLVGNSNSVLSKTRAREAAVNLSRELLERAHQTPYAQIGDPNWSRDNLDDTSGQSGSINSLSGNGSQTNVSRRGTTYTVAVSACSVDDASDGYGVHTSGAHSFCSDSGTAGSADSQAEDFKRVATTISWSFKGRSQQPIVQTATFGANGASIGPSVTNLAITSPSGLSSTAPTITSPSTTSVTFQGTSVGASDMKFSVDGVEQTTGVTNQGNGSWQFAWNISTLTDGVYLIGATAVDALGTRGPTRTLQVKLARGVPVAPQNVTGNYNWVYVSGTKTLVAELSWDANPEGNVTGYEVLRGSTTICAASLAISCVDLNPSSSGSSIYTVRTLYNDASGNAGYVSSTYNMTAPSPLNPTYVGNLGQASCFSSATSTTLTVPSGGVAAGNRVVLRLEFRAGSSGTVSASDSKGNTYSVDADPDSVGHQIVVLSAHVATALVAGDTIQVSYPSRGDSSGLVADVLSNVATTNAVDRVGTASGNAASAVSTSVTTTNATDILVGAVGSANGRSITQPTGWNGLTGQTPGSGGGCKNGAGGNSTNAGAYRTVSSAGTYTYDPVLGGSGIWTGAIVAYKGSGATTLSQPNAPSGLSVTVNSDGTRKLTWTAPSGTPAVEFYRIYRDGRDYTDRLDTAGATGSSVTWTDTNTGSTSHTYRVTAATQTLVESDFAGPVTG